MIPFDGAQGVFIGLVNIEVHVTGIRPPSRSAEAVSP